MYTLVLHQHFSHGLMRSNSTGILQSGGTFEPLQAARLYCAPYADADDQIKRHCGRYKYSSTYPSIHHASLAELAAASPLPSLVCAALQSMSRSVQATGTQQSRYAYMMQPLAPDSFPQHVLQHTCESECDGATGRSVRARHHLAVQSLPILNEPG